MMKAAFILIGILFLSTVAFSATILVPDDYATIQGAIDASSNGDTIVVRPGTYVENINFVGKAINVKSEQGANVTTVDGSQSGSVMTFWSGEGSDSVLDGFTVTNGASAEGGGIYCWGASPTIMNNTISENSATDVWNSGGNGGGICCREFSSPNITNNTISGNLIWHPIGGEGAGICCKDSSPTITNNTITVNTANGSGGGIWCSDSSSNIASNIIAGNSASSGGGIACSFPDNSPTITNNIITGNTATIAGGIYCVNCLPIIANNAITGNTADEDGGGILCWGGSPTITNNTISKNTAEQGGGISCQEFSSPTITDNSITGNWASKDGGGIFCYRYPSPIVTNTILWDNSAPTGTEIWLGASSTLDIFYSYVDGWQSSCYVDTGCTLNWGDGNIDADPLFVDAANNDFHLTWNSPCRDTGDNSVVTEPTDFEGDPRIALGTVDMGADEYYYHLYHMGDVIPGSPIDLKVVGYPSAPVTLYLGSGIADPPYSTQHGDFFLNWPPLWQGNIGTVPGNGVLVFTTTVPSGWTSGSEHPLQALVGPWGGQWTRLTNLETLIVE